MFAWRGGARVACEDSSGLAADQWDKPYPRLPHFRPENSADSSLSKGSGQTLDCPSQSLNLEPPCQTCPLQGRSLPDSLRRDSELHRDARVLNDRDFPRPIRVVREAH
jgi:hypothetical protein